MRTAASGQHGLSPRLVSLWACVCFITALATVQNVAATTCGTCYVTVTADPNGRGRSITIGVNRRVDIDEISRTVGNDRASYVRVSGSCYVRMCEAYKMRTDQGRCVNIFSTMNLGGSFCNDCLSSMQTYPASCSCPNGQYKRGNTCYTCSNINCARGKYRSGSCSGITNGYTCSTCKNINCPGGEYRRGSCSGASNGYTCNTCADASCGSGQYRSGSCSGTTNGYTCKSCENINCRSGTYRSGSCSGTRSGYTCKACSTCTTGKYMESSCNARANTRCAVCTDVSCGTDQYRTGTCSGNNNGYHCNSCANTNCLQDQYRTGSCGGTKNDYRCNACSNINCGTDHYRSGSCSGTANNYKCNKCSNVNCGTGTYRSGICSGTSNDYRCKPCNYQTCPPGRYRQGSCKGTLNDYSCKACARGQFKTGTNEETACTVCKSGCKAGEYEKSACKLTSDLTCARCDNIQCPAGKYRTGSCTGASNGFACPTCPNGQYKNETSAATSCTPCTEFCPAGEYTTSPCGSTSNLACARCDNLQCSSLEFRTGSCGGSTNGYQCNACSNVVCAAGQYRQGNCSGTLDGFQCTACPPGQFKANASNATVCSPKRNRCGLGFALDPGDDAETQADDTACKACKPKFYSDTPNATRCTRKTTACADGAVIQHGDDNVTTYDDVTCSVCDHGFYTQNTTICAQKTTACPPGAFISHGNHSNKTHDDSVCKQCSAGFYTTTLTATACRPKKRNCNAAGHYLLPGNTSVTTADDSECRACPDGSYTLNTTACAVKTQSCPDGHILVAGNVSEKRHNDHLCLRTTTVAIAAATTSGLGGAGTAAIVVVILLLCAGGMGFAYVRYYRDGTWAKGGANAEYSTDDAEGPLPPLPVAARKRGGRQSSVTMNRAYTGRDILAHNQGDGGVQPASSDDHVDAQAMYLDVRRPSSENNALYTAAPPLPRPRSSSGGSNGYFEVQGRRSPSGSNYSPSGIKNADQLNHVDGVFLDAGYAEVTDPASADASYAEITDFMQVGVEQTEAPTWAPFSRAGASVDNDAEASGTAGAKKVAATATAARDAAVYATGDSAQPGTITCGYVSAGGIKCRTVLGEDAQVYNIPYCTNHRCPVCGESKSSKTKGCSLHPDGNDALLGFESAAYDTASSSAGYIMITDGGIDGDAASFSHDSAAVEVEI